MTDFRFSDDGMGFIFQDVLASLSTYTIGNSGSICFRNQAEKDAFMKAVEQEEAVRSGDMDVYETEPKMEERNTEAWLEF